VFKKNKPYQLTELSKLQHSITMIDMTLPGGGLSSVLVLKFSGTYGHGSEGNPDADYIHAITAGACALEFPDAVVFDLSAMAYEWGERIASVFDFPLGPGGGGAGAVRIVSGPKNHKALVSLKPFYEVAAAGKEILATNLEQALESLARELKSK